MIRDEYTHKFSANFAYSGVLLYSKHFAYSGKDTANVIYSVVFSSAILYDHFLSKVVKEAVGADTHLKTSDITQLH